MADVTRIVRCPTCLELSLAFGKESPALDDPSVLKRQSEVLLWAMMIMNVQTFREAPRILIRGNRIEFFPEEGFCFEWDHDGTTAGIASALSQAMRLKFPECIGN